MVLKKDDWQGTWLHNDGAIVLKVPESEPGRLQALWIEDDQLESYMLDLRKLAKHHFINLQDKDKLYWFAKFNREGDTLLIWLPFVKQFKNAIEQQQIQGKVITAKSSLKSDDVVIESANDVLEQFFVDKQDIMLFDYENPLILQRLPSR
jgi:hypothetical protein